MPRASRAKRNQDAAVQPPAGYDDATSPEPPEQDQAAPEPVEQDEAAPKHEGRSSADAVVRVLPVHRTPLILLVFLTFQRHLMPPERFPLSVYSWLVNISEQLLAV